MIILTFNISISELKYNTIDAHRGCGGGRGEGIYSTPLRQISKHFLIKMQKQQNRGTPKAIFPESLDPPTMVSFQQKDEKILNLLEIWKRVVWYQHKTFL
jgi:hypothetical protein